MTSADIAFVNGAVYTVDAARTRASAVAVRDGRIAAVGTDDEIRDQIGSRTETFDLHGRMLLPGFQDAHVHPVSSGLDRLQCDLHDLHTARRVRAGRAVLRGGAPGPRVDPRERLVDGRVPGRNPDEGPPRCRRARPHRVPAESGRPQHVGQQPRPRGRRRHVGNTRSGRRPDRARRDGRAQRHPPRGCRGPRGSLGARIDPGRVVRGPAGGPALPAFPRDHRVAGRDRVHGRVDGQLLRLPPSGRQRRSHRPRGRGPVVGPGPRRGADRRPARDSGSAAGSDASPRRA